MLLSFGGGRTALCSSKRIGWRVQTEVSKYHIESVARAAQLLCAYLRPPHRFGVTELSNITGLTKNQTFRILQTLMPLGFVLQDSATKEYLLGPRLISL